MPDSVILVIASVVILLITPLVWFFFEEKMILFQRKEIMKHLNIDALPKEIKDITKK